MLKPFPKNKFSDLTPKELHEARNERFSSLLKLYDLMRNEQRFTELEPTRKRIETELQQIRAELTKDK